MNTNISNSSLSGKFRKVTFSKSSEQTISKIIKKEFLKTNCPSKSFELIKIASRHNLRIAQALRDQHNSKY